MPERQTGVFQNVGKADKRQEQTGHLQQGPVPPPLMGNTICFMDAKIRLPNAMKEDNMKGAGPRQCTRHGNAGQPPQSAAAKKTDRAFTLCAWEGTKKQPSAAGQGFRYFCRISLDARYNNRAAQNGYACRLPIFSLKGKGHMLRGGKNGEDVPWRSKPSR